MRSPNVISSESTNLRKQTAIGAALADDHVHFANASSKPIIQEKLIFIFYSTAR